MLRALNIAKETQEKSGVKLVDFLKHLEGNEEIKELQKEVR